MMLKRRCSRIVLESYPKFYASDGADGGGDGDIDHDDGLGEGVDS